MLTAFSRPILTTSAGASADPVAEMVSGGAVGQQALYRTHDTLLGMDEDRLDLEK